MSDHDGFRCEDVAPGKPGIRPTWTSSAKDLVGCTLGGARLWFTLGFGIVNEVYYPRVDIPQIRDLGFIVADGNGFWSEVKRLGNYSLRPLSSGVPAVEIVHRHERFTLQLRISPDPRRDVLGIECRLEGEPALRVYVLLAPHLGATGFDNVAATGRYRGRRVLWAERGPFGVALAAVDERQADAISRASAGYVGTSDGWQDFAQNGAMRWEYAGAGPGNVALMAELPRRTVVALGFAASADAAATLAISSLMQPFDNLVQQFVAEWETWQARRSERYGVPLDTPPALRDEFLVSTVVLRTHLDKTHAGALVASLSIPWGDTGDERGGYHLVWPRDLVECAGALLAFGADQEARDTLRYLIATQNEDGHWHQNQWLGGKPYWTGIQLDETAFPVLLAAALHERDALRGIAVDDMVRRALGFIARNGPATAQDRWEENDGVNAFTLAVCIAALVAGAEFLPQRMAAWLLDLADFWNANVERWTAVGDTDLGRRHGVGRYYVRGAPRRILDEPGLLKHVIPIRNRTGDVSLPGEEQIGTDFLRLVRFGLRSPTDPLVLGTLKLVDAMLRVDTPNGPTWHRYNGDGYGEHEDGSAFDGTGIGRGWPLLTGERGHYELAAGKDPLPYLEAMAAMASPGGMIPEQVWDSAAIPARRLFPGRPSGSAMPLAWAHAEFIKLMVSRQIGYPFDRPRAAWARYKGRRRLAQREFWWPHAPIASFRAGARLVIALPEAATVRWGLNGWNDATEQPTADTRLGFHAVTLDLPHLSPGARVDFTWRLTRTGDWHGHDYVATAAEDRSGSSSR